MNATSPAVAAFDDSSIAEKLADVTGAFRRRRVAMAVTFGSVLLVSLLVAALLPATYRSAGTILIEQQEIPEDFVRSAVQSFADQRVQMISQRVMTSTNLLEIIDRHELYGSDRKTKPREQLIQRVRDDIALEMISADVVDPRRGGVVKATIAFSVAFKSREPELAAAVANDLVSLFLRENLETRRQLAEGSAQFLAGEAERLRARTEELAEKIAVFKREHLGQLPEYTGANLQELGRMEQELREASGSIRTLDLQLATLNTQLDVVDAQVAGGSGDASALSPADQLKLLKAQQAAARARYSPGHPDVRRLAREIAQLEQAIADGTADDLAKPASSESPARTRLEAQREYFLRERADLVTRRDSLRQAIAENERAQRAMPDVERDYKALLAEAQSEQEKYAEIRQKLLAAQLSQNLETEQKGERFTLIDPPVRPQEPISPNRPLIAALGLLLALAGAVGILTLLEAVDTRVHGRRQLVALVGEAPLAVVPWGMRDSAPGQTRASLAYRIGAACGGLLLFLLLVHLFYRPLDVLWTVVMRRIGL
jgi:polysaccharide chain length determinant protein (PEP-CTERM system associated)